MNHYKRITYLDVAKGILILLLMVSHFNSATRRLEITNESYKYIYFFIPWFTCFFMQCFFFISGYCSNFKSDTNTFIKKQIKQILIPWITIEIIDKLAESIFFNKFTLDYFVSSYVAPPNTGLWFFSALLFSKITLFFLQKKCNVIILVGISLLLLLLALIINEYDIGYNILGIRNGLAALFFVTIGYVMKKNELWYNLSMKYSILLFPVSLLVLFTLNLPLPILDANVSNVGALYIPIILIVTLSGSFFLLFIARKISSNYILEYFGKNSIIIYGLHFTPLMWIIKVFSQYITPNNLVTMIIYTILIYITLLLILVLIIQLFNTKYLKWIIGK